MISPISLKGIGELLAQIRDTLKSVNTAVRGPVAVQLASSQATVTITGSVTTSGTASLNGSTTILYTHVAPDLAAMRTAYTAAQG